MKQPGYILVASLMILSLAMVVVTALYRRGFMQLHFDTIMINRQQARALAYSGIECAKSQLLYQPKDTKNNEKADPAIALKRLVPVINQWQVFKLTKDTDGIDGIIKLCIMCEGGKIPLNQWFDTTKRAFTNEGKETGDMKVYLQTMLTRVTQYAGNKKLFEPLEKYLKQKDTYLYDISQLLTIKEFQQAFWPNEFYEPPTQESDRQKRPVYLMDLFSLWSDVPTISAWFLTDSVSAALGLNRTQVADVQKRLKIMQDAAQSGTLPTTLEELWPVVFRGMYGKDINALPAGSDTVLNVGFDSKVFSVLSYGTVGKVTFKLYGILQQVEKGDQKEYKLVRLYAL